MNIYLGRGNLPFQYFDREPMRVHQYGWPAAVQFGESERFGHEQDNRLTLPVWVETIQLGGGSCWDVIDSKAITFGK